MNASALPLLGGIEAGGTKFVLAIARTPTDIIARHEIPTLTPEHTLDVAARWFEEHGPIDALGIASFGPVALDRASPDWGHITNTPKPSWGNCDLAGFFARRWGKPIGFDTDVNGAALAEFAHGAGQHAASLAYITVGTGIGGGLIMNGKPIHGLTHPEMGHIFPRRHAEDQEFPGICPHHRDCLEGLTCGPAIKQRWGRSLSDLPQDHAAHEIIADYLAQMAITLIACTAVEVIVMGGGVMKTPGLLGKVRDRARTLAAGYFPDPRHERIVSPGLGDAAGITGALGLAATV